MPSLCALYACWYVINVGRPWKVVFISPMLVHYTSTTAVRSFPYVWQPVLLINLFSLESSFAIYAHTILNVPFYVKRPNLLNINALLLCPDAKNLFNINSALLCSSVRNCYTSKRGAGTVQSSQHSTSANRCIKMSASPFSSANHQFSYNINLHSAISFYTGLICIFVFQLYETVIILHLFDSYCSTADIVTCLLSLIGCYLLLLSQPMLQLSGYVNKIVQSIL